MKKIIFTVLLAFVVILGINARTNMLGGTTPVPIGGANTYPHMTGMCNCGKYPSCHPSTKPEFDENGNGYIYPPR